MARLFGTDGVRGIANGDLSCELAFKIGQAGARVLTSAVRSPRILIGRDTRISGEMLGYALMAGICSVGAEAVDIGVMPTPGVAHLVSVHGADAAVVISASHNSFEFNGIKWFNSAGFKLSDEIEDKIEAIVLGDSKDLDLPQGEDVGCPVIAHNALEEYIAYLIVTAKVDLTGLKIVVDCANGAASEFAPVLFRRLGATVYPYFNMADGCNINKNCGSTHPQRLSQLVVEHGADAGIAFDGDADRLIAVDEFGVIVDGDKIMSICAIDMKNRGTLAKNTLVVTVMSNLGMKITLKEAGIDIVETDVGDRYVLERMVKDGFNIGGEQSGHIIFLEKSTTGDGMLSSLELMGIMARNKVTLSQLARMIKIFPQVLVNVSVPNDSKYSWKDDEEVKERISQTEKLLGDKGRIFVRTSGTEPLIRIMLEGEDNNIINREAIEIATLIAGKWKGSIKK